MKKRLREGDPCPVCSRELEYMQAWDALYCHHCNAWKENYCTVTSQENEESMKKNGYPQCFFECWKRPEKPFPNNP